MRYSKNLIIGLTVFLLMLVVGVGYVIMTNIDNTNPAIQTGSLSPASSVNPLTTPEPSVTPIGTPEPSEQPGQVETPSPSATPKASPIATPTIAPPTAEATIPSARPSVTPTAEVGEVNYKNKVAVLMYHIFNENPNNKDISQAVFKDQLDTLIEHGFHFINMEQFLAFKAGTGTVPDNAVLLTFDDGYMDFYTVAFPLLRQYNIPATNFIVVVSTDTGNPGGNPHLTWDQMREMVPQGMSFYSHTYNSHIYFNDKDAALVSKKWLADENRNETVEEYRTRVRDDLLMADTRIQEELGTITNVISYPYGKYNDDVLRISEELGHKVYFTIQNGLNGPKGDKVYRINAGYKSISGDKLIKTIHKYVN